MVDNLFASDDTEEIREPFLKTYSLPIIPDYKDMVKTLMNLGTIKNRLANENFYFFKRDACTSAGGGTRPLGFDRWIIVSSRLKTEFY